MICTENISFLDIIRDVNIFYINLFYYNKGEYKNALKYYKRLTLLDDDFEFIILVSFLSRTLFVFLC